MIVAIDGPVGVGKSRVASAVARRVGLLHIDTGAMYRALALKCLEEDLDPTDGQAMTQMARRTRIRLEPSPGGSRVFCDDQEVTEMIRTPEISGLVSKVSVHQGLREVVVEYQRHLGQQGSVIMEGRDVGTVVFPHADVKLFLDADLETRVKRRAAEYESRGVPWSKDEIRQSILARDESDTQREISPLRVADDAIVLDTSNLSFDEVVDQVVSLIRSRIGERKTHPPTSQQSLQE